MISKELPWSTLKKYDTPTPIQYTVYSTTKQMQCMWGVRMRGWGIIYAIKWLK